MKFLKLILYIFFACQYLYAQPKIENDLNLTDKLLSKASFSVESNLTMTKEYANQAMEILYKNNHVYDKRMIQAYNLVAYVEIERNNIGQAKLFLQHALTIQNRIKKDHEDLILTYFFTAQIEQAEKKYTAAIKHFKKTVYLIKHLDTQKNYKILEKKIKDSINNLLPLAKTEIVYHDYSFLDFVNEVKKNYPNIDLQVFLENKDDNNKSIDCALSLCKKIMPQYIKIDSIYSEYLKNPSQTKENLFDYIEITNFNYLLDTIGICILGDRNINIAQKERLINKYHKDIQNIFKYSKNPIELKTIIAIYKKYYGLSNKLALSQKVMNNSFLSKTDFFKKLDIYRDILLKEQNPNSVGSIPKDKRDIVLKRYKFFQEYFQEYFSRMKKIIMIGNYNDWKIFFNKLNITIKKHTSVSILNEQEKAKIWAASVMLYFKSTLDDYNILFDDTP